MGCIFTEKDAAAYDLLLAREADRPGTQPLARIFSDMFRIKPGQSMLDVGCGTGWFLHCQEGRGLALSGIDPSEAALSRARLRLRPATELFTGAGEDLPFGDNSFDVVSLANTLEFVEDPAQVLAEAARVARERILLLCANRWAGRLLKERLIDGDSRDFFAKTRLFSVWEIKRLVRQTMGEVPLRWDTVCRLPVSLAGAEEWLARLPLFSGAHFGAVMAFDISVRATFRVRPIPLATGLRAKRAASGRYCLEKEGRTRVACAGKGSPIRASDQPAG